MAETEVVKTQKELLAEMKVATDAGDWKGVSKISSQIAKVVKAEESAEKDAKEATLAEVTKSVKAAIDKVVNKIVESMAGTPELEAMDGVWYSWDFGETLVTCRVVKSAKRKSGGGGGGKKFNITTNELLEKHGDEEYKDGESFKSAYESNTDGNSRYKIRMKLLKAEGLS